MNKITKFLLIVVGILLAIYLLLTGYIKDSENISKLVGSKIGGGELSMTDYYSLAQCVETYTNYLAQKEYESAYKMLNNNYRAYMSFEEYKDKASQKDNSKIMVEDIEAITPTTYRITTNASGEKEQLSIIINKENNNFLLLPFSFLDYKTPNTKESHKGVKCVLNDYIVNTDETIFHFNVTNQEKNEVKINTGKLYTNFNDKVEKEVNISIPAKETKEITISFKTEYAFPKKVILYRDTDEKKDIEYVFEINQ